MDPESHLIARSFGQQLSGLEAAFEDSFSWPDPHAAFGRFVLESTSLWKGKQELQIQEARLEDTPILSSCGYLIALSSIRDKDFPLVDQWHDHVKKRFEQKIVSRKRHSFFFRPYDLLGVALGLHHIDATKEIAILKEAIGGEDSHYQDATLVHQLVAATAAAIIGADWNAPVVMIDKASLQALCFCYWLRSCGARYPNGITIGGSQSDLNIQILKHALQEPLALQPPDVQHVAIVYYALNEIVSKKIEQLGLGFRSEAQKLEFEEKEERKKRALQSVEKVERRIEKRSRFIGTFARVAVTAIVALILTVLELYGLIGLLESPPDISELPSQLWDYLSEGWIPVVVFFILLIGQFVTIYKNGTSAGLAERIGNLCEHHLRSKWL